MSSLRYAVLLLWVGSHVMLAVFHQCPLRKQQRSHHIILLCLFAHARNGSFRAANAPKCPSGRWNELDSPFTPLLLSPTTVRSNRNISTSLTVMLPHQKARRPCIADGEMGCCTLGREGKQGACMCARPEMLLLCVCRAVRRWRGGSDHATVLPFWRHGQHRLPYGIHWPA